ncbi:hypothetical protein HNY73_005542 [Argiope bruennichi]|uniref:Uncharacterized protein n=1 Tax=Argiope bruennichi TaxID=94029 RepID=A0A8T0FP39_ARGBR|nr:hypothetical protein HNY73_005542 [Argiope bruennichi]
MILDSKQAVTETKVEAEQAKLETKLRNERANLCRLFTISANTFDEIHRKVDNEKDIHIQYSKLIEKAERLFKVDEEIKELIDYTDEDCNVIESYRDRFTEIEYIMKNIIVTMLRHYALLCADLYKGDNCSSKSKAPDEEQNSTEVLLTNLPSEREIYLKTIKVRLWHKELNLSPSGKEVLYQGLFGGGISPAIEHGRFTVTVESFYRKYSTSVALLGQPKICSTLPRIRDENLLAELSSQGIKLTDFGKDKPPIRVLLGEDVLGSILTGNIEIQTMKIMNAASFELRCWAHSGIENKESQNVLGLKWDTKSGELYCVNPKIDKELDETVTKRKLLSIVNSIYDPLGFTSPATLLSKLLLQEA